MPMKHPPHPGRLIENELDELGWTDAYRLPKPAPARKRRGKRD